MVKRKHVPDRTKLAAAICALIELPHEQAKAMSEGEILGLVDWDHFPHRHADGGKAVHWNLRPMLRHDHVIKTKVDAADMAHERKVRRAVDAHTQRMLLKTGKRKPRPRSRWPKRPFRRRAYEQIQTRKR
jgi:hypothetical protein